MCVIQRCWPIWGKNKELENTLKFWFLFCKGYRFAVPRIHSVWCFCKTIKTLFILPLTLDPNWLHFPKSNMSFWVHLLTIHCSSKFLGQKNFCLWHGAFRCLTGLLHCRDARALIDSELILHSCKSRTVVVLWVQTWWDFEVRSKLKVTYIFFVDGSHFWIHWTYSTHLRKG